MIGAAIGSAVGGIMGGRSEAKAAKRSQSAADKEAALAREYQDKAIGAIEDNQGNVDDLQNFLTEMGDQGVEYAQGLFDSWEGSFGGIQDNMTDYYNNLDPTKFATQSKANFQASMDKQMKQFNETMAAGGLQSAGMKQQAAKEAAFKMAEGNAQIDIQSEEYVAQQKMGFLGFGEQQRAEASNANLQANRNQALWGQQGFDAQTGQSRDLANAMLGGSAFAQDSADRYGASAAGHATASGNYYGAAMSSGMKAVGGMFGESNTSDPLAGMFG